MNDKERGLWVNNDEGLYTWWLRERMPMRNFIKIHRDELTKYINKVIGNENTHF